MAREDKRQLIDSELRRVREQLLRGPDKWAHHLADLSPDGKVLSAEHDRPVTTFDRLKGVGDVLGVEPPTTLFALPQRTLTPRAPYQQSPLSYIHTTGYSWMLNSGEDTLEWLDWFGLGELRPGALHFNFRFVPVGATGLVSIYVTASSRPGVTGNLEVGSTAAAAQTTFPYSGIFVDATLDIIVRRGNDEWVRVWLAPKVGVQHLRFKKATYTALS